PVLRTGSSRGQASVTFFTTTNGTASAGTNYIPVTNVVTFQDGQVSNIVQIPVLHDPRATGSKTVVMVLSNSLNALLFAPSIATLTIVDVERLPGQLFFSQTNYVVSEASPFMPVTVVRTNGSFGGVSVNFSTGPGTAIAGFKYGITNGSLFFDDGQLSQTFTVPI